jgi:hypothetical protein
MDWIKKHTDQFSLALMGLVLIALSVLLVLKAQGFEEGFSAAMSSPARSKEVPKLDLSPLETAQKQFSSPPQWTQKSGEKSLFTSLMLIEENGALVKAIDGYVVSGNRKMLKAWLLKYGLNILSSAVFDEDPDKDGFTNYDEYVGADLIGDDASTDPTDPNNKESHPPYYTKLFLKQWIKIPFLVTFQSYDGDPSKPKEMTFQINAISRASKTEFLELGQRVANSTFVLEKFEKKEKLNKETEVMDDVSELSIRNTETNELIVLVLGKKTDSPDSYGSFLYFWPEIPKPLEIKPKKLQEFVLKPNVQERYKLIDIKEDGAVIQLPGGDKTYNVPLVKKALELQK